MGAALLATAACNEKHGCCYDVVCPLPPPLMVVVSPTSATLAPGDTIHFLALVAGSAGDACKEGAKPPDTRAVRWSVSNESVAAIARVTDSTGVTVRGGTAGTATLIAAALADTTVKAAAALVVK